MNNEKLPTLAEAFQMIAELGTRTLELFELYQGKITILEDRIEELEKK